MTDETDSFLKIYTCWGAGMACDVLGLLTSSAFGVSVKQWFINAF